MSYYSFDDLNDFARREAERVQAQAEARARAERLRAQRLRAWQALAEAEAVDRGAVVRRAGPLPGDALTRPKMGNPLLTHWGVYVGDGMAVDGQLKEVRFVPVEEFGEGREMEIVRHDPAKAPRALVVRRALYLVGANEWTAFENNCESLVRYCQEGERRSEQADLAKLGLGLAALWWLL